MARDPKRGEMAAPLDREWDPPADHPFWIVRGKERGVGLVSSFDELFLVSAYFALERKFLPDAFPTPEITRRELDDLQRAIGCRVPDEARRRLHAAVRRFIAGVVLEKQAPAWKELRDRLKDATSVIEQLLKVTAVAKFSPRKRGFIPADLAVSLFLESLGLSRHGLERIASDCRSRIAEINGSVKRGTSGEISFRILMKLIVSVAYSLNLSDSVLSHQYAWDNSTTEMDRYPITKLMTLSRHVLGWAETRADEAIAFHSFPAEEHDRLLTYLRELTRKSDRNLVTGLEGARASLREEAGLKGEDDVPPSQQ